MADDVKHIVRIARTNLNGLNSVESGLTGIKGIGPRAARTLAAGAGVDPKDTLGALDQDAVTSLDEAVANADEILPEFMRNRRRDPATGEDTHVIRAELDLKRREDLERMKKIKSYRGVRHIRGHKVRGQRTRSTGRTGSTVGVERARLREEMEEKEKEAEEEGEE